MSRRSREINSGNNRNLGQATPILILDFANFTTITIIIFPFYKITWTTFKLFALLMVSEYFPCTHVNSSLDNVCLNSEIMETSLPALIIRNTMKRNFQSVRIFAAKLFSRPCKCLSWLCHCCNSNLRVLRNLTKNKWCPYFFIQTSVNPVSI